MSSDANNVPKTTNGHAMKRASVVTRDSYGGMEKNKMLDDGAYDSIDSITTSGRTDVVELKREVGLAGGISFIVGGIIGSGIFVSPKGIARGSGSVGMSLVSWAICGIISIGGSLCYAELGTLISKSGGEYAYLHAAFGPVAAYLFSWISIFVLKPSSNAIIAMTCSHYVLMPFYDDDCGSPPEPHVKLLTTVVLLTVCLVNCYSVKLATRFQIIFTIAKVLALIIILVGGIVKMIMGNTGNIATGFEGTHTSPGTVILGLYSGMWAYDGWNSLNYLTEEVKNPNRNMPLSIISGIFIVMFIYITVNVSYFTVMSVDGIIDSSAVGVTWAQSVIPQFSWIIPIAVAMSTFGACNASLFGAGRVNFVAAREGHVIKILSMVHITRLTPMPAIMFTTIIAILYVIPGDIGSLIDFFSFTTWSFYGAVFTGLIVMRYREPYKSMPRAYKVWLPIPCIMVVISIGLIFLPIVMEPQMGFLYAFLIVIVGLIFYYPFIYKKWDLPFMKYMNCFLQLLYQVCPSETTL